MDTNKENLLKIRHSAEHVLMHAMRDLGLQFLMAMGPATDSGFYFDFELLDGNLSESDFPRIEAKMNEIIKKDLPIIGEEVDEKTARELFSTNPYKQEWLDELKNKGEKITVYWTGKPHEMSSFVDLCKGPHVKSTGEIGVIKLLSTAGAYWRGNEKNKMLTRIYGTAFSTQSELDTHRGEIEKRRQNDHRILGQKLDLFTFSDLVGKGLVMYTPNGTIIKNQLKEALVKISRKYGVQEVDIPHMAKIDLYKISGHADKFSEELFRVTSHFDEEFVLKPVNCPHHTQIYASRPRSYKDLPIRYIESTQQHRDEKPGAMSGLNRTRSFEIDDGHTFCTPEQIKQEAINTIKIIEEFYTSLGMWGNHWISLSLRDSSTPEKYIGDNNDWVTAETLLREINDELNLNAKIMEGEAALYGPKIDFMLKDALGNDRQLGTVQIDFAMPKRFNLEYIAEDGTEKTPVMLHRAILGSYGRFIANLLESTGGAFPVWLAPVQVVIIPISEKTHDYAKEVAQALFNDEIRYEIDDKDETMGNKIRKAQELKIPYMIILGEKESAAQNISVRNREGKQQFGITLTSFTDQLKNTIISKSQNL